MVTEESIRLARSQLMIHVGVRLDEIGGNFLDVGAYLRDLSVSAHDKARYLFEPEGQGYQIAAAAFIGEARRFSLALVEFDRIVAESTDKAATYSIYCDDEKWQGDSSLTEIENLKGLPAIVVQYLQQAGFHIKADREPSLCHFTITR